MGSQTTQRSMLMLYFMLGYSYMISAEKYPNIDEDVGCVH